MKQQHSTTGFRMLGLLGASGAVLIAGQVDLTKLPPAANKPGVTYAKEIRPLFEASCLRCHSGEKPKAGLRLDTLEAVLKGSKEGKIIVPGQSEKSPLVIAVAQLDPETSMPPKPKPGQFRGGPNAPGGGSPPGPRDAGSPPPTAGGKSGFGPPPKPLTPEQVGLIRAWVDQGAK